jgi:hypothetical protein
MERAERRGQTHDVLKPVEISGDKGKLYGGEVGERTSR